MKANNRPKQRDSQGKPLKGIAKTRLYYTWNDMHRRCYDPKNKRYHSYGEKGITVCDEWNRDNPNGYMNFRAWSIANGYSEDLTIDRIDPNEDYTPMNCRWTDYKTQERNRRNNHPVTVNGTEYHSLAECCEALGMEEDYKTIFQRITQYGWTVQEAFTKPIRHRSRTSLHKGATT